MAERFVDHFEIVEIDVVYGNQFTIPGYPGQCVPKLLTKHGTIRQISQRIMTRQVRNPSLSFPPFGDILQS